MHSMSFDNRCCFKYIMFNAIIFLELYTEHKEDLEKNCTPCATRLNTDIYSRI